MVCMGSKPRVSLYEKTAFENRVVMGLFGRGVRWDGGYHESQNCGPAADPFPAAVGNRIGRVFFPPPRLDGHLLPRRDQAVPEGMLGTVRSVELSDGGVPSHVATVRHVMHRGCTQSACTNAAVALSFEHCRFLPYPLQFITHVS
jgi:hypothetical protein